MSLAISIMSNVTYLVEEHCHCSLGRNEEKKQNRRRFAHAHSPNKQNEQTNVKQCHQFNEELAHCRHKWMEEKVKVLIIKNLMV